MSIGLALSGGGAKGMAHIGVLAALIDNGVSVDYISGCSSGSIIASLYACGYSPAEMLKLVKKSSKNIIDYDKTVGLKLFKTAFSKKVSIEGFVKGDRLESLLRNVYRFKGISNICDIKKLPLAIPAVDLQTGEVVYYTNLKDINSTLCCNNNSSNIFFDDLPTCKTSGDLADIVRASCSFPGVFIPKIIDGKKYIDGGVRVNTPVKILKAMGAEKIISVCFDCNNKGSVAIENVMGISHQAINIMSHTSDISEQELSDVNIRMCIKKVSLLDFSKSIYLARRGYNIVNRNIEYIKNKLGI